MTTPTDKNRITSPYSYTSAHPARRMTGDNASALYERLKPFLRRVVTSGSFYLPPKWPKERGNLENWPLAYRPHRTGGNVAPRAITWNPRLPEKPLTFTQFLNAYNITVVDPV